MITIHKKLIFDNCPYLIQSEAIFSIKSSSRITPPFSRYPISADLNRSIDFMRMDVNQTLGKYGYLKGMIGCLSLLPSSFHNQEKRNEDGRSLMIVIGLGGGILTSSLHQLLNKNQNDSLPKNKQTTLLSIELDGSLLDISQRYFGFEGQSIELDQELEKDMEKEEEEEESQTKNEMDDMILPVILGDGLKTCDYIDQFDSKQLFNLRAVFIDVSSSSESHLGFFQRIYHI